MVMPDVDLKVQGLGFWGAIHSSISFSQNPVEFAITDKMT